jgi:hypothetical protein
VNWVDFFNSLPGQTIYAMVGLAFVDFILGAFAAIRDGTFQLDALAAFIRSNLVGKVFGIALLILAGGLFKQDLLTVAGYGAATAYTLATVGSIIASWGPKNLTILGVTRDAKQPVPTD